MEACYSHAIQFNDKTGLDISSGGAVYDHAEPSPLLAQQTR